MYPLTAARHKSRIGVLHEAPAVLKALEITLKQMGWCRLGEGSQSKTHYRESSNNGLKLFKRRRKNIKMSFWKKVNATLAGMRFIYMVQDLRFTEIEFRHNENQMQRDMGN